MRGLPAQAGQLTSVQVTTFGSFPGGAGRTMAPVNVGVQLARKRRRVPPVGFDLGVPGLDTSGLGTSGPQWGTPEHCRCRHAKRSV